MLYVIYIRNILISEDTDVVVNMKTPWSTSLLWSEPVEVELPPIITIYGQFLCNWSAITAVEWTRWLALYRNWTYWTITDQHHRILCLHLASVNVYDHMFMTASSVALTYSVSKC